MKCEGCGAQIDIDQRMCPYCGRINDTAVKRGEHLRSMEERNRREGEQIIKRSGLEIFCKIHKWVNVGLVVALVIACVASFSFYYIHEYGINRNDVSPEQLRECYENGDLESLYYLMSKGEYFGKDGYYGYAQAAFFWRDYMDCQNYFARSYEKYTKNGYYDSYWLQRSVECGYDCLTFYMDSVYSDGKSDEKNMELSKEYQEKVRILMLGVLQIPKEMLEDLDPYDYDRKQQLVDYVLGVHPHEE